MRKIEIYLDELSTDGEHAREQEKAIAYLSTWAFTGFDEVKIFPDLGKDMIAGYRNSATGRRYTIGAIWRDGKYEFHS